MSNPSPSVPQAFTLDAYFNSSTTDPLVTPTPATGLSIPAGWGVGDPAQGYAAWRSEWRAWNPGANAMGPPFWNAGLNNLVVGASVPVTGSYFAAPGQVFAINLWDLMGASANPGPSTATNAVVEIAAFCTDDFGDVVFTQAPFAKYCWGPYSSKSTLIPFPSCEEGQSSVQICQADAEPVPYIVLGSAGNTYQAGPNTTQRMNVASLISFVFNSSIVVPVGRLLRIQIALYLTLTPSSGPAIQCFDDPQMDVDSGG